MEPPKSAALILAALLAISAGSDDLARREGGARENNLGVALLEQFHPEEAVPRFRRALEIDSGLAVAQVNLALALLNLPDLPSAQKEAEKAAERLPDSLQARYVLGLVAKGENRVDDAMAAFAHVLAKDPADVGARVNRGQLHLQARRYEEAIADFQAALAAEAYNGTALYNLGLALTRAGRREEGQKALERFQELRDKGYGTSIGTAYGEQGRYASAVATTGAEPELVDAKVPGVKFVLEAPLQPGRGAGVQSDGRVTLFDFDGDGALDILDADGATARLYRNAGGRFTNVTRETGLESGGPAIGVLAADYDNDGKPDILALGPRGLALLHNEGGRFADVTAAAGLPAELPLAWSAAFADVDHDGDLDLVVTIFSASATPSVRLFRSNGNGTFADVTAAAGLAETKGATVAVVPTDFDNRRDLDLLLLRANTGPALLRNLRDGRFRDDSAAAGLPAQGSFTAVTAADVDKDGRIDFFFATEDGPGTFALSDGLDRFHLVPGPAAGAKSVQLLDYDNDGLLDLVTLSEKAVRVFRNLGGGRWSEAAPAAIPAPGIGTLRAFASGDLDGDGDLDLVLHEGTGALYVARNEGGNRNRSLRIDLQGRVSNKQGVGARVEMRSGSLRQRLETAATTPAFGPATLLFGLGARTKADTVRILWPSGTLQAELDPSLTAREAVVELDRKPSSCPFLYAWNGKAFEFLTDFMGGGEMGYGAAPRLWNTPVPEEWVRIRDDQLVARDGRYELRVTNELEEVLFLDRVRLIAVTHPADVDVYPNEGLVGAPRRPFRLHAGAHARPPVSAQDHEGRDVLDRLARVDRQFVDGFPLRGVRGYAEEHALTLDLGPSRGRSLLLLTGWTDYAFSSDNLAASHAGMALKPPSLEVEDDHGGWTTVVPNIGIPVGRPQTVAVALDGLWRGKSRRVRIVTSMRIYWDQALVADESDAKVETQSLDPVVADLRERGFSAEVRPDGNEPVVYDYARVSRASPWKLVPGRYTREGDVRELVRQGDDLFVISRPGDEIALSFEAAGLPALEKGWRRTFLLYSDGYSKEMDINSATPDTMGPLPFRAMSRYPYQAPEAYPLTPDKRAVMDRYNTRVVRDSLPPLELARAE
jgi:tetratricopeptide (TPR) repeat protein